jgi:hypothetical protein
MPVLLTEGMTMTRRVAMIRSLWLSLGLLVTVVGCLLLLRGCNEQPAPGPQPQVAPPATKPADNSRHLAPGRSYVARYGFSILPPAGYEGRSPGGNALLLFLGPEDFGYSPNIAVSVKDDDGTPIEKLGETVKNELKKKRSSYTVVTEGLTLLDGKRAYAITAQYVQGAYNVQSIQYLVRSNGRVYTLTFTAHARALGKHKGEFETAAKSAMID